MMVLMWRACKIRVQNTEPKDRSISWWRKYIKNVLRYNPYIVLVFFIRDLHGLHTLDGRRTCYRRKTATLLWRKQTYYGCITNWQIQQTIDIIQISINNMSTKHYCPSQQTLEQFIWDVLFLNWHIFVCDHSCFVQLCCTFWCVSVSNFISYNYVYVCHLLILGTVL